MAKVARPIRVASNPMRKAATRKKKGTKNPMTAAKKKEFVARMAKARKASARKSNPSTSTRSTHRKKSNPAKASNPSRRPSSNKRRRNPTLTGLLGSPKEILIQAVTGLLSAVATRQVPQMALGAGNAGWKGYLANAGTGLASTWLAGEFAGAAAAQAALIGSTVIILDRVLTEHVSPIGQYLQLAGVGDATSATSLGTVADGYYIHPTIVDSNGRPIIPHEITDAALSATLSKYPQLAASRSGSSMAGAGPAHPAARPLAKSSRFASRF